MTEKQVKLYADFTATTVVKDDELLWSAEELGKHVEKSQASTFYYKNYFAILENKSNNVDGYDKQFILPYSEKEVAECLKKAKRAQKRKRFAGKNKRKFVSATDIKGFKKVAEKAYKRKIATEAAREEILRLQEEEKERVRIEEERLRNEERKKAEQEENARIARKKEIVLTVIRMLNILCLCLLCSGICTGTAFLSITISHCTGVRLGFVIAFNGIIVILFGARPIISLIPSKFYDGWNWNGIIFFLFHELIAFAATVLFSFVAWLLKNIDSTVGMIISYDILCLGLIIPYILFNFGIDVFEFAGSSEFITPIDDWRKDDGWVTIGVAFIVWICVFGALFIFRSFILEGCKYVFS
ncbi:hypothetical protein [Pumilibacter muris]|uniref:hypothetical protein n=1 Tax=Pumilibacter muris TaxID=2941510 RepID=UPI002040A257|nr:hypothetical protein [Pumilibacter muris]